ncbi:septum site-determining protein MinC [Chloropicon roscoffensis]|uniref:Septum site-determining protein MinC n=2 Tax=Chloropicon roscoffensis TaxID=1461544 RepID=A0AAX4PAR6_9CHLO
MVVRSGYRAGTGRGWTSLRRAGPRTRCGAVGGSGRGCVLIKRTLRGGQVEKHDGDVVVIGDVNKDSTVSAGGDVAVFGRLSGEVHAGNKGDTSATVSAICFEPSQIRIADVVAVMGAQSSEPTPYPEVARIEYSGPGQGLPTSRGGSTGKGRIMVEPAGQFWQQLSARGRKRKAARMSSGGKLKWTAPAKSARLTGLYLLVAGISLIAAPKSTFGLLFDVRTIATGWIQVFGAIAAALGMYYVGTAVGDTEGSGARGFYASTVAGRIFIFITFCYLVSQKFVEQQLILLAVLNLVSAVSMYYSLQR